jgi:hypothetical protein
MILGGTWSNWREARFKTFCGHCGLLVACSKLVRVAYIPWTKYWIGYKTTWPRVSFIHNIIITTLCIHNIISITIYTTCADFFAVNLNVSMSSIKSWILLRQYYIVVPLQDTASMSRARVFLTGRCCCSCLGIIIVSSSLRSSSSASSSPSLQYRYSNIMILLAKG